MAVIPTNLARVSNNLRTAITTGNLTRSQVNLLKVQNQLSTGKQLSVPSDDPGKAAIIQSIRKTLEAREGYLANLKSAQSNLSAVDTTLGELTDLLREAEQIASANVGSDVTADARSSAATIVGQIYSQVFSLANKQFDGTYLFGGDRSANAPFVETGGGAKFVGSATQLANDFDEGTSITFTVDGNDTFGALSTRVKGSRDLAPALTVSTRLIDVGGAMGEGVRPGSILLVNGAASATVDLSKADTLGDVVDQINAAGVGVTASIAPGGAGLRLVGTNVSVAEVGNGTTAAVATLNGGDLNNRITPLTRLADLAGGAGVDPAGLIITNGTATQTVDLSTAVTVQDFLNAVNSGAANVRAEIDASGRRINLLNPTQGIDLTIGENGGTTADDLGIRSFSDASPLSELNGGKGVRGVASGVDFTITNSAGASFGVDISAATDIASVISAINAAATGVTASLATSGNGIVLTDTAGGAGTLSVADAPFSYAAKDLGLDVAASGTSITGRDVNPVKSQGMFANLQALQTALKANDTAGITAATERIHADLDRVIRVRGETGARVQEFEDRQRRLEDQTVATKALLSDMEDVDYTEAITRFQTLQTALQATLQTAGATLNLSLLDFLA